MINILETNRGEMGRALQGENRKATLGGTSKEVAPVYKRGPR